jgi:outer membrane protein OmpA-like peptidoglycan-associated protein
VEVAPEPVEPATMQAPAAAEQGSRPAAAAPLLAAAKAPVNDVTAGLVLGYTPGSVAISRTADTQLHDLAQRMRQDPTMIIALEGFAGGGDSLKARRLAMWRARAVRTRLMEDGIATQRIRLRAAEADAGAAAMERVDVRIVQP